MQNTTHYYPATVLVTAISILRGNPIQKTTRDRVFADFPYTYQGPHNISHTPVLPTGREITTMSHNIYSSRARFGATTAFNTVDYVVKC